MTALLYTTLTAIALRAFGALHCSWWTVTIAPLVFYCAVLLALSIVSGGEGPRCLFTWAFKISRNRDKRAM